MMRFFDLQKQAQRIRQCVGPGLHTMWRQGTATANISCKLLVIWTNRYVSSTSMYSRLMSPCTPFNDVKPQCTNISCLSALKLLRSPVPDWKVTEPSEIELNLTDVCGLQELPESLGVTGLTHLALSHNNLSHFPPSVCSMLQLEVLELSYNDHLRLSLPPLLATHNWHGCELCNLTGTRTCGMPVWCIQITLA